MRKPASRAGWSSSRATTHGVLASMVSLLAAIAMLTFEGIKATRLDFLVIAMVLAMLLVTAWMGTRRQTEAEA